MFRHLAGLFSKLLSYCLAILSAIEKMFLFDFCLTKINQSTRKPSDLSSFFISSILPLKLTVLFRLLLNTTESVSALMITGIRSALISNPTSMGNKEIITDSPPLFSIRCFQLLSFPVCVDGYGSYSPNKSICMRIYISD